MGKYVKFVWIVALAVLVSSCGNNRKTAASGKTGVHRSRTTERPDVSTSGKDKHPETKTEKPAERKFVVLQAKYADKLGVKPDEVENLSLYEFVDNWYGAPYKYAGREKSGVDCSGFTSILINQVYRKNISGPSYSLFTLCEPLNRENLKEGDLVFFKINKGKISHVGVYLQNNKFVHASTRAGVIISDLNEAYYQKYFYKGGRLK